MRRRTVVITLAVGAAAVLFADAVVQKMRGPVLPAYEVAVQPLVQTVVATGRVSAVSRAQVGSSITGIVRERRVREGDQVRPGDVLAVLQSDVQEAELRQARAALAELQHSTRPQAHKAWQQARTQWQQAQRELQRRTALVAQQAIAHEELEQAAQAENQARIAMEQAQLQARSLQSGQPQEALALARVASAQAALDKTIIRAEMAGTILTRNAEPGDVVQAGQVLFDMARAEDTEVLVALDEKNLETLALGQPATCIADAYPHQPFTAQVSFIAPRIDPQRGTVDVRLTVAPVPEFLRQDMTISVNIQTGQQEQAIAIPNDAIAGLGQGTPQAWVVEDGRIQRRTLHLGLRGLAQTQVLQGVQPGDWVLADGQAALTPGQRVQVQAQKLPWAP
ncbi:efflux RND transporter periplasmic adaptor subunit [Comamonas nitrativorans]|uniref:Efflux RND transporter periplasmic adaptor subunit n=1 Tax=Comamonas nitrativorans TaxID=108437 RepID=A0ABV9GW47_9BURK